MLFARIRSSVLKSKQLRRCLALSVNRRVSTAGVRVRFGPSPTGFIHLGGLRTAFYNYLFAKQNNGSFILRIEDTDQERVVDGSQQNLEDMLVWTGLIPDEGPTAGGQYGPYIQSQRTDLYREKVKQLLSTPMVYRCFCSDMRLDLLRKEKLKNREIPKYDNRCRHLSQREIDEKLANGEKYAIRLKLKSGPISFDDMVFGRLSYDLSALEADPVIFKSDGFPTYHFANVVDDHYMKITHVLRGVEWQVSTPKHIMLYEAFGWTPPVFAHLPLVLNKDGSKLSKRQNDIRIDYYRDNGFYSESLLNYLATIGSGFPHRIENRIDKLEDLITSFDLKNINLHNGKIETDKLRVYNRSSIYWYLDNGFETKLIEELKNLLINKFGSNDGLNLDTNYLKFLISWSKERIFTLKELLNEEFLYLWKVPNFDWKVNDFGNVDDIEIVLKSMIDLLENIDESDIQFDSKNIYEVIRNHYNEKHLHLMNFKKFMRILRLSLTNLEKGSPIGETMQLLGPQKSIIYLKSAYNYVTNNLKQNKFISTNIE